MDSLVGFLTRSVAPGTVVTPVMIIAAIGLIVLLVAREIVVYLPGRGQAIARYLTIAVYPLIIVWGISLLIVFRDFVRYPPALH